MIVAQDAIIDYEDPGFDSPAWLCKVGRLEFHWKGELLWKGISPHSYIIYPSIFGI